MLREDLGIKIEKDAVNVYGEKVIAILGGRSLESVSSDNGNK